ncbi:MAG: hypothetical protein ACI4BB_09790 [Coprococcus sp.]
MGVKTEYTAGRGLRRKAVFFWILSGVLIAVSVGSVLLYRNPWLVHRLDADQATAEVLERIAESSSPYIKIDGMELSFTGYYKVDNDGDVCSYCYMGAIGDDYILADLPADDHGAMLEEAASENKVLKNFTLCGQLVQGDEMTACLAEAENMPVEEYRAYYRMSDVEVLEYGSDQERVRIYQLMFIVLAAGTLAVGCILLSESKIAEEESKEESI